MWTTLPNLLTAIRIACIPIFIVFFYSPFSWANVAACVVFSFSAITDTFDGYLARKLSQTSKLGAFLDPVADKLLVCVVLLILMNRHPGFLLLIPTVIIISREIMVCSLREWMAEIGARSAVKVSWLGKFKTFAQMLALGMIVYEAPLYGLPIYYIGVGLLYFAVLLTLISMQQYLRAASRKLVDAVAYSD